MTAQDERLEARLAEMRKWHAPWMNAWGETLCESDWQPWPCNLGYLLSLVDSLTAERATLFDLAYCYHPDRDGVRKDTDSDHDPHTWKAEAESAWAAAQHEQGRVEALTAERDALRKERWAVVATRNVAVERAENAEAELEALRAERDALADALRRVLDEAAPTTEPFAYRIMKSTLNHARATLGYDTPEGR